MEKASLHSRMGSSRLFQGLKTAFPKVTGLSLKIVSAMALMAAAREEPDQHPFCKAVAGNPQGCVLCQRALLQLRQCGGEPPRPCEVPCLAGLTELGVPVMMADTHVATLVAGPVLTAKPHEQTLKKLASKLQISAGKDGWTNAERAYRQIPVLTAEQRSAAQQLMTVFAGQLAAAIPSEAVALSCPYEPPCVAIAKRHVQKHLSESVRTHEVARSAHVSLQHFCRVFHQTTGETFTDYLARQRVERAKQLLAKPQLSIGEVAYGSGFRSLT